MDFFERVRLQAKKNNITLASLMNSVLDKENAIGSYNGWRYRKCIPRADVCLKMATLLNVSVPYLITGEENESDVILLQFLKYKSLLEKIDILENNDFQTIEKMVEILVQNSVFGKSIAKRRDVNNYI